MKLKYPFILMFILLLMNLKTSKAQLNPGDIAFIGFNSDNPDGFAFIALADIPADSVIYFTDKGWSSTNEFYSGNEGILQFKSTGISSGEIIYIEYINKDIKTVEGNGILEHISGTFDFSTAGDQILAFTGTTNAPNIISAIHFNGTSWDTDATSSNTSALPDGLINNSTAVAIGNTNDAIYAGDFSGTAAELLVKINNPDQWFKYNSPFLITPSAFPYSVVKNALSSWNVASDWISGQIPSTSINIIVPDAKKVSVANTPTAHCRNIEIYPQGKLEITSGNTLNVDNNFTIQSRSISQTGSLINKGSINVTGDSNVECYLPSSNWHIISTPVSDQKMGSFAVKNDIDSFTHNSVTDYDLAPYDESSNDWFPYTLASDTNTFVTAKGYSVRRTYAAGSGVITFTGTLNSGNHSIGVTRDNFGWNCIGNPYPSSIKVIDADGIIQQNIKSIDRSYAGIYLWDSELKDYTVINETKYNFIPPGNESILSQNNIAVGQGFIIKADNDSIITFNSSMQQNSVGADFKSSEVPWPAIRLNATLNEHKNSTIITFNPEMTPDLDPMYDVGKFKGNPDFSVFSTFQNENNLDLAVQALPLNSLEQSRIPIGIDCSAGGTINFSIEESNLPTETNIYIEDTQQDKLVRLNSVTDYSTVIQNQNKGTGRFYLQIKNNTNANRPLFSSKKYSVFTSGKTIQISGDQQIKTAVFIYGLDGKLVYKNSNCTISEPIHVPDITSGIYVLRIKNATSDQKEKINLN